MRVLIAASGTGGHFYPGLAVLEALRERTSVEALFVGTSRGIEARAVPAIGEKLALLEVSGLKGKGAGERVRAMAKLPRAGARAWRTVREFAPDLMLSVGGYASGPVTAIALATGVPTAVIEPNAVPGLTNRLLGRFAARAYLGYPEAARHFRASAVRTTGVPVRREFVARAANARDTRGQRAHVLVAGGSQGAKVLNETLSRAVAEARAAGVDFSVTHQTGAAARESVAAAYQALGIEAEVVGFIDDVASAMAAADLVVCRAGAGTIAELCVVGRPAVYVPLPTAADDHQRRNAEAIAAQGAGVCLVQRELSAGTLAGLLGRLLGNRSELRAMGEKARAIGSPAAAQRIADDLLSLRVR